MRFSLLPLLALAACSCTPSTYTIQGTTSGNDGDTIYLMNKQDTLQTQVITAGTFTFQGKVEAPERVCVATASSPRPTIFFLEPGTITLDLATGSATGTRLNDAMADFEAFVNDLRVQLPNSTNPDSLSALYDQRIQQLSAEHVGNPLGLLFAQQLAYDYDVAQLDSLIALSPLYQADEQLKQLREAKLVQEATAPGKPYTDIQGVDAISEQPASLSAILAEGKPVIVDFWASWCGPCRREIVESLSTYAQQYAGRVNFVGIAVWEESIDDTRRAMSELPISWPVIFAGDRENSPTQQYGINGIPHIMLLSPDGTIVARDLRGQRIAEAIDQLLAE